MRIPITLTAVIVFTGSFGRAEEKDNYAAVAYSTKTGEYWFSWGMESREKAEAELSKRATDRDSLTIVVVKNCYIALARTKDGKAFGVGEGDVPLEAQNRAMAQCRKQSKVKCSLVVTLHAGQGVGGDSYSCIAYSPSTGRFAVAAAKATLSEAEAESVKNCKADDARVVATATKTNCCCLALGKDKGAYGVGVGASEKEAQEKALEECKKKTTDCFIAATLTGKT